MSPPSKILDCHIHLWPAESCNSSAHSWMSEGHFLTKPHLLSTYQSVANDPAVKGVIYVETDRTIPTVPPPFTGPPGKSARDVDMVVRTHIQAWGHQVFEEIKFLRSIVENGGVEAEMLRGVVLYAPMQFPGKEFKRYLSIAEDAAGPKLWERVVGFRFLLQGKKEGEVERLVSSEEWIGNLITLGEGRGGKGWTFDVGIDTNRDGEVGLESVRGMIEEVRRRGSTVRFILNHLCKPPLSSSPSPAWTSALKSLSSDPNIYMKLSGAFNEFASPTPSYNTPTPDTVPLMLAALRPYLNAVFEAFPDRVMFGSDWPVCNVGGPKGEEGNWGFWRDVVQAVVEERGMSEGESEGIWWRTGGRAYGVSM